MSKDNKQYKKYSINDVEHACSALNSLIAPVEVNLEKYKEYYQEAIELLVNSEEDVIPAKEYENVYDKILHRQHELLKFIADHHSSSFSYMNLRGLLLKSGYLKNELNEDIRALLNEFLNIRNWTFHNPQSMLVAEDEVVVKRIPEEFKEFVKIVPQVNPVIIKDIVGYTVEKLASFIYHLESRIRQFEMILSCMKNDYQELYDSIKIKPMIISPGADMFKVQYCRQKVISGIDDFGSDIAQISMAIQKSKYDGSDDKFNEWVIRRNKKINKSET